jgi:hypothetical protein
MTKSKPDYLVWVLALAFLIRLAISWSWIEVADTANYRRVAETLARGGLLYRDTASLYPYPPLWSGVEAGALWFSQHSMVPFLVWVELLPTLSDLGAIILIDRINKAASVASPWRVALYAFNPLLILITVMHGQFDSLPVFFSMLAYYLFDIKKRPFWAAASLALAVAIKSFPVILLPLFLFRLPNHRSRVIFAALTLVPVALLLLPFLATEASSLTRELFGYQGVADQGWLAAAREACLLWIGRLPPVSMDAVFKASQGAFAAFYLLYLVFEYAWCGRRASPNLASSIAAVFLGFYVFYAGISSQYLIWVLPFLAITEWRTFVLYSLLALAATCSFYSFRWPEILYRAKVQIASEALLHGVYVLGTAAWWIGCCWSLGNTIIAALKKPRLGFSGTLDSVR